MLASAVGAASDSPARGGRGLGQRVADALRRAKAQAESIRDEYEPVDVVRWLVELHATGGDALRRVARLEAYLAES